LFVDTDLKPGKTGVRFPSPPPVNTR